MTSPDQKTAATSDARAESAAHLEWAFPNRATPAGSSAYYAIRMTKSTQRDALAALFALRAELQAIPDRVSEPGIARLKLDWWRSEIDRLFAGEPRHPLSHCLAPIVAQHQLPQPAFIDLIEAVERQLRAHRHATLEAQRQSDEQDLGALFELIARCEGAQANRNNDQGQYTIARRIGGWCAPVRRIRDAGLLLRRSREVLPADQLAAAGLSHQQLASAQGRQRLPELLRPIAMHLRAAAPDPAEAEAQPGAGRTPAIRVQLRLHQELLVVLERSSFDVADQRISLTPLRKLWLAWRAA
jgi:phytoene synthase